MINRVLNYLLFVSKTTNPFFLFLFLISTLFLFILRIYSAPTIAIIYDIRFLLRVEKNKSAFLFVILTQSLIVLLFSKITSLKLLVVGKLITFFFLPATGVLFYLLSRAVFKANRGVSVFISTLYILSFQHYCFKMLSDITNNFFLLSGL